LPYTKAFLANHLKYEPLKIQNVKYNIVYVSKLERTSFTLLSQHDITHDTMLAGYPPRSDILTHYGLKNSTLPFGGGVGVGWWCCESQSEDCKFVM